MRNSYFSMATLVAVCLLLSGGLQAQTKFLDPMFGVSAPTSVTYATNISARIMGPQDLTADVYEPTGETDTDALRPVVVLFHTGNFLPRFFNGGAYGTKSDSANVEILSRLVQRGYVGMSATYRDGWQPTASLQAVRTGSLLQAVYRASQDAHAMARFLRKTVEEDGNPYRIDPDRIVFWGMGSGGYVVLTHNFLDNVEQIAANRQFYDDEGNLLVNPEVIGNVEGDMAGTQNLVNHAGYSSDVAMTVNVAGALGDSLWIDGDDSEAPTIAMHSATDPFAPFYFGTVTVPTDPPMEVVDVPGSNLVISIANEEGINEPLAPANVFPLPEMFSPLSSQLNAISNAYENTPFRSPIPGNTDDVFPLGRDNLWPVVRTAPPQVGLSGATTGVWNWFNPDVLRAQVAGTNAVTGAMLDAEEIISNEAQTNPNGNNPERAKANIDTLIAYYLPRAWYALDLDALVSSVDAINPSNIDFQISPNPAAESFLIETGEDHPMQTVSLFDMNGRLIREQTQVNSRSLRLYREGLPNGTYIVRIQVEEGISSRRIFLR